MVFSQSDLDELGELLGRLPGKFWAAHTFAELAGMDIEGMLYQLVSDCGELELPDYRRVRIIWKVRAGKAMDRVIPGKCQMIPKKERELAQRAARPGEILPWWEISLGLDAWCLMNEHERWAVLHHEASHCGLKSSGDPRLKAHDIEEFGSTMLRYGAIDPSRVRALAMGVRGARADVMGWFPNGMDDDLMARWHALKGDN